MKNVTVKEGFNNIVVWPGTTVPEGDEQDFESFIKSEFNVEAQYLEQIETKGGRVDLFFAVKGNMSKFCLARLQYGMRWLEDVLSEVNYDVTDPLYDERVFGYLTKKDPLQA